MTRCDYAIKHQPNKIIHFAEMNGTLNEYTTTTSTLEKKHTKFIKETMYC